MTSTSRSDPTSEDAVDATPGPSGWCLAYGVTLHATPGGLIVEGASTYRVRLGDSALEERIVDMFARRDSVDDLEGTFGRASVDGALEQLRRLGAITRARPLVVMDRLGVDLPLASDRARVGASPEAIGPCELAVLVARRDDDALGEALRRCHDLGVRALVVCLTDEDVLGIVDDPSSSPCARCALWFDRRALAFTTRVSGGGSFARSIRAEIDKRWVGALAARLAARSSELRPGIAAFWSLEVPCAGEASFPRHPACSCGARQRREPAPPTVSSWDDARAARFTPVVPLGEAHEMARVAYRGARGPWPTTRDAYGIAIAAGPDACVRAMAEAIERFAMLHASPDVQEASREELGAAALDAIAMRELLFRDDERRLPDFRFVDFEETSRLAWSWATRGDSDERILVPTSLVGRPPVGALRLVDATSNGYACHTSRRDACERALLEVVERDALLLRWYTNQDLVLIEGIDVPGDGIALLATLDVDIPVVALAACLEDGSLRIGSAAALRLGDALDRARHELVGQLSGAPSTASGRNLSDASRGYGPRDHVDWYSGVRGRALFDRWCAGTARLDARELERRWPGAGKRSLDSLLDAVRAAGLEPLFVDRSLPELFGEKWHVVRALVPGAVEMSWGQPYRRLASRRVRDALASGATLSSEPHPYA